MAPIIPFIPHIIGAAGSAVGGWLGGRKSKEEKSVESAQAEQAGVQTDAMKRAIGLSGEISPMALRTFRRGAGAAGGAVDYWRRILSGKTGASEVLSPEINQIINSYRNARISSRTLNPRGAGTTELTRRIDEELVPGQISGLLASARPAAARDLGTTGTNLLQSGIGALGTAGQLLGQGAGAGTGLLQYGAVNRKQGFDFGTQLAGLLAPLAKIIFPGPAPPTTTPTPTPPTRGPDTNPGGEWGE